MASKTITLMPTRREIIKTTACALGGLTIGMGNPVHHFASERLIDFTSRRPALGERRFTSAAVEAKIREVKNSIADKELAWMFETVFPTRLIQLSASARSMGSRTRSSSQAILTRCG